jgi:N-acetyl-anhydromuramyl-L-alanine amidase AmpD
MAHSLLWLPQVLRNANLKVAEVAGWETRGIGDVGPILGVICHHTGGRRPGIMPALRMLAVGREHLRGPLAQLGLGRDGTFFVVAAGKAHHAGTGSWKGADQGNMNFIGIEAQHSGSDDEPWPQVQLAAYKHGVAAILQHLKLGSGQCAGHKEYALPHGRKRDPNFDMEEFRVDVAAILAGRTQPLALIPQAEADSSASGARPTLRRGSSDPFVATLQRKLKLPAGGLFDAHTEATVRAFQRNHTLVPDGIVGPKTWAALGA